MRTFFRSTLPALLALTFLPVASAQAQGFPDTAPFNKASFRDVAIPLAQPSTGDYLLAIARAADANLLADATDFPEKQPPLSGQWQHFTSTSDGKTWKGKANDLLLILLHERKLTLRQLPAKTFLLWSEPDMATLGKQAASAMPRVRTYSTQWAADMVREMQMRSAVAAYLMQSKWDGQSEVTIPLAQLPTEAQNAIGAYARKAETLNPTLDQDQCWFRDDFWKSAVFHFAPQTQADDPSRIQITGLAESSNKWLTSSSRLLYFPNDGASGNATTFSPPPSHLLEVELLCWKWNFPPFLPRKTRRRTLK